MLKSIRNLVDFIPFILILTFMCVLAVSRGFSSFTVEGVKMYFALVFPTLFPFLFLTSIISAINGTKKVANLISPITKRLFRVNGGVGYAYLMSLLCGYPVGAMLISQLKKDRLISDTESTRGSVICSTCSPSFVISAIGLTAFNDLKFGVWLYLVHILTNFTVGMIFARIKKDKPTDFSGLNTKESQNMFYDGVFSAINSALFVGGVVTLFYILTEALVALNILSLPISLFSWILKDQIGGKGLVLGLIEYTKGLKILSALGANPFTFILSGVLLNFSGVSILFQSICFLKSAKIKTATFLFSKITAVLINLVYSFLISLVIF